MPSDPNSPPVASSLARALGDKPRLLAVASFVTQDAVVVDVGCDHAWLPIALVASGRCPRALAVDIRPAPVALARRHVRQAGLEAKVEVLQSDGLARVPRGIADTLTIAGVGARTAVLVTRAAAEWGIARAVVQPNKNPSVVRRALLDAGWGLVGEQLVEERGRLRVVMAFARDSGLRGDSLDATALLLGPYLCASGGPLFAQWVRDELAWRTPRAEAMTAAGDPDAALARADVAVLEAVASTLPRGTTDD